jgi:hypothetical protein
MQPVNTHKALSNRVFLFGFQPYDAGVLLISTLIIWGLSNSFIAAFVWLSMSSWFFRKMKYRPDGYFKSFVVFLSTSYRLSVKGEDGPAYKDTLCNTK